MKKLIYDNLAWLGITAILAGGTAISIIKSDSDSAQPVTVATSEQASTHSYI